MKHRITRAIGLVLLAVAVLADVACAQRPDETPAAADANEALASEQQQIAEKYQHFEDVLLQMAELSASTDPRRAALLRQTLALSKNRLVNVQFEQMAELLADGQLSRAVENQEALDKDLAALLQLLMSENRERQLASEKARIRDHLKRLGHLIRQQRDIRGRTGGGDGLDRLAQEQGRLAQQTDTLAKDVQDHEEAAAADDEPPSDEDHGAPSPDLSQADSAAGKRVAEAHRRMNAARQRLEESQRDGARQNQEEALAELEQARAELETILRQLREEELQRVLTSLDVRLRKMLDIERAIHAGTVRLDKIPTSQRTHAEEIEAARLANDQSRVIVEADKALTLLREDGSAVALPEALAQAQADMRQVAARLGRAQADAITQAIEEDILTALEEMLAVLQKALDELDDRERPRAGSQTGQPQERPLVDQLSELKMIRSLQMRINRRTERYVKLLEGDTVESGELRDALGQLAERQADIHRITRDLDMGRNE